MKFAKSLLRNQVPEWTASYIDYKGLKKLVKRAAVVAHESDDGIDGGEPNGAGTDASDANTVFFYALDRSAEIVDSFYNSKYAEYSRRLRHIVDRFPYKGPGSLSHTLDSDEIADLVGILLELRSRLRKLQWYAEVNKRGFSKILKKFDKKVGTRNQSRYFSSKILILPFASYEALSEHIATVNNYLNELAPELQTNTDKPPNELLANLFLNQKNSSTSSLDLIDDASEFRKAIENDDPEALEALYQKQPSISQKVSINILLRALSMHSNSTIPVILRHCDRLEDPSEINNRNVIHRLIIHIGRKTTDKALERDIRSPNLVPMGASIKPTLGDADTSGAEESLALLLQNLTPEQHSAILEPDQLLRTPLHYSARYGLVQISRLLLKYIIEWKMLDKANGVLFLAWRDSEGQNPVDLAVENNHPKTTAILLEMGVPKTPHNQAVLTPLLLKAVRLDSTALIGVLSDFGCDVNFRDSRTGESVLYVAAKYNFIASTRFLIGKNANMEAAEDTYGWSPLFVAAVDGSDEIAKALIAAGALMDGVDGSGWTAKEHAALRGHIELSKLFPPEPMPATDLLSAGGSPGDGTPISRAATPATGDALSIHQRRANHRSHYVDDEPKEVIKTFGHGYLEDASKTLILVTLGAKDVRYTGNPVELQNVPLSKAGQTELDTALSLVVSATNAVGESSVIDLPTPEFGLSTEPVSFYTDDPSSVQLHFDLIPTYSTSHKVLGRAVALLSNIVKTVGVGRSNLNDTLTVPLMESTTLQVLGTVTFGFMLVTPFTHPKIGIGEESTYWKSLITTRVIGHRGLGKNTVSKTSLQLGENTIESFIQAANLGASYVEFDVQLTKDHVPVIYHDFLVSDSGFDIPMHLLTLEQFMNIHKPKKMRRRRSFGRNDEPPKRSMSMFYKATAAGDSDSDDEELDRMRLTRDFKANRLKGNVRGHSIQSKFATLEELFKTLPKGVGFNIECKYPMIDELEAEDMESVVIDINEWVDTVLKCVYDFKDGRDVMFSSFNPDVCALLSLKQPSIPVLFLTESGTAPMMDVRASSLQEAIRFAKCWNLLGIVSESTPLIDCPRLVGVVKNSGLVCFTYGALNNVPANARRQLKAGVDAVIVDSVLQIRKELTGPAGDGKKDADAYISALANGEEPENGDSNSDGAVI